MSRDRHAGRAHLADHGRHGGIGGAGAGGRARTRTHIANLRHKIERADARAWSYIQTEAGVGYRFCD
jgi:DNA-binding response OmpR family regulator